MSPCTLLAVAALALADPQPSYHRILTLDQLSRMNRADLEWLYRVSPPAPALDGYYPGRSAQMPRITGIVWKGKYFDTGDSTIINRWCGNRHAVLAQVHPGESWLDGKPSLIMDYRGSSRMWRDVRDELREVCPGLYLGIMFKEPKEGECHPTLVRFFALQACGQ